MVRFIANIASPNSARTATTAIMICGGRFSSVERAGLITMIHNDVEVMPERGLALQLPFQRVSESMGNHDSKIVDADSVD